MVKPHEKKYQNYFRVTMITTYDVVKFPQNLYFEKMDTDYSTEKYDGFRLPWEIFKELYRTKYYYGSLKKSTFSFSFILIGKKII